MEKATGKTPKGLTGLPEAPRELVYLWWWYCDIYAGTPLVFAEIKAWSELKCINVQPFEVDVLKRLDRLNVEQ